MISRYSLPRKIKKLFYATISLLNIRLFYLTAIFINHSRAGDKWGSSPCSQICYSGGYITGTKDSEHQLFEFCVFLNHVYILHLETQTSLNY